MLSRDYRASYHILLEDLERLSTFIHPSDPNLPTYSHRTYELYLRTCTEFEGVCKALLVESGFKKRGNWTIREYQRLNTPLSLSDREVGLLFWHPSDLYLAPFKEWSRGSKLPWYQDYNLVKHNRAPEFARASFKNVLLALAGLFAVHASKFGIGSLYPGESLHHRTLPALGKVELSIAGSPFSLRSPAGA